MIRFLSFTIALMIGVCQVDKPRNDFKSAVRTVAPSTQPSDAALKQPRATELRIISAKYGARDKWLDVTRQVSDKLQDDTLSIQASNAIAGDPLFGIPKILKVEYVLDGRRKEAAVREGVTLNIPPVNDPLDELQVIRTPERLTALVKVCPAEVGFFGKNLNTGMTVEYRPDQPACLASIVKIFVLLEVVRQVDREMIALDESITIQQNGKQETCTISEALDKMIGLSDNEATGALASRVGYDQVNALPRELGISGLSERIVPEPGILDKVLDKRVYNLRVVPKTDLPPQHGTARAIAAYFELLNAGQLINENVSRQVLEVLDRNPKYFAPRATPVDFKSGGKGGSILWVRPFRAPYNMAGWGLLIRSEKVALCFCIWFEWFPKDMSDQEQWKWCSGISDCIVNILLPPASS